MRGAERAAEDAGCHALGGGRSSATLPARQIQRDRASATDRGRPELRRVLAVPCCHQTSCGIRQVAAHARWCRGPHEIWGLTPRFPRSPHGLALPQTGWRKPGGAIRGEGTRLVWNRISSPIRIRVGSRATVGNPGGVAGRRPLSCGAVADFDSTPSGGLQFRSLKNGANGGFLSVPRPTLTR
jgi:hypothetical protein